ncbi:uncharacterized protein LOC141812478 [Curcuma longa]|uniref:uncharacterized protein LOC141812478 n=1 Tax=Curcuma longa TaxID=136217 RepID=UPI003D9DB325
MDSSHIWPHPQPQAATAQTVISTSAVAPGAPAMAEAPVPPPSLLPDSYFHYAQPQPAAQPRHFPHPTAYSTYHYYLNPNPNPNPSPDPYSDPYPYPYPYPYSNPAPEAPLQSDAHAVHLQLPADADVRGHYAYRGGNAMLHPSSYSYDVVPPAAPSVSVVFHGHTQGLAVEQVVHSYDNFPLGGGAVSALYSVSLSSYFLAF